jgi:SAM-dependent methyltransferase
LEDANMPTAIVDYDAPGYDYRRYWLGRDYERLAEERALRRLVPQLGRPRWLVDLGGGFGRNAAHYRTSADRYVIVDYSVTNLRNASRHLADDLADGRAYLVRADLNALPFANAAFDTAIVVRVLHHLPDLSRTLGEMGRVVGGQWLLDVPIKNHALAWLRALARGDVSALGGPEPLQVGISHEPFWNFQLAAVRRLLAHAGWEVRLGASVNNLRRWDQLLPPRLSNALRPVANLIESATQRLGTGWWGPNQFLLAHRPVPQEVAPVVTPPVGLPDLATLLSCPACLGPLSWHADSPSCDRCQHRYQRTDAYWDFTIPAPAVALGVRPRVSGMRQPLECS